MATQIELRGISTAFDGQKVLDNLNLTVEEDEFLTLLGPSGCGKTTTLRIIEKTSRIFRRTSGRSTRSSNVMLCFRI